MNKYFSIAYHRNFLLVLPISLTLKFHSIGNVKERKKEETYKQK